MDYRYGLPWNQEAGERKRLFAVATLVVPLFLVAAAYITWVELPEQDRKEREALPPQLAKLIVEKQEPPPPPELKAPEPEPEPEPEHGIGPDQFNDGNGGQSVPVPDDRSHQRGQQRGPHHER